MPKRALDGSVPAAAKKKLAAGKKYAEQEVFIHNDCKLQKLLRSLVQAGQAAPVESIGVIVQSVTSGQKVYDQNLCQCFCALGQVMKGAGTVKGLVSMLNAYLEVKSGIVLAEEVLEDDEQMFLMAAAVLSDQLQASANLVEHDVRDAMEVFREQQGNPSLYELLVDKVHEQRPNMVLPPWPSSGQFTVWIGGEPTKESTARGLALERKRMEVWMADSWSAATTLRLVNGQVVDLIGRPL